MTTNTSDLLTQIRGVKPREVMLGIIVFLSTIAPGFLIWFWFRPEIFSEYDFLKVAMLSVALTLPVMSTNTSFIIALDRTGITPFRALLYGALASFMAIYSSLLLSYYKNYNFKLFLLITIILNYCCVAATVLEHYFLNKRAQRNSKDEKG